MSESSEGGEPEPDMPSFWEDFNSYVSWDVESEHYDPNLVFYFRAMDKSGLVPIREQAPMVFRCVGLHCSGSKGIANKDFSRSSLTEIETI